VNGTPAFVDAEAFVAHIFVEVEETELAAVAMTHTEDSAQVRQAMTVVEGPEAAIRLHAHPPGGLAPLEIGFSLSSLVAIDRVALDLGGTGSADFDGASLGGATFVLTRPGVYPVTVRVTDTEGQLHVATTLVEVYDRQILDARLQVA